MSKKNTTKQYKLWIKIEEITTDENGEEYYIDLEEEETRSVGEFDSLEEAISEMNTLGNIYQGKH